MAITQLNKFGQWVDPKPYYYIHVDALLNMLDENPDVPCLLTVGLSFREQSMKDRKFTGAELASFLRQFDIEPADNTFDVWRRNDDPTVHVEMLTDKVLE